MVRGVGPRSRLAQCTAMAAVPSRAGPAVAALSGPPPLPGATAVAAALVVAAALGAPRARLPVALPRHGIVRHATPREPRDRVVGFHHPLGLLLWLLPLVRVALRGLEPSRVTTTSSEMAATFPLQVTEQ